MKKLNINIMWININKFDLIIYYQFIKLNFFSKNTTKIENFILCKIMKFDEK